MPRCCLENKCQVTEIHCLDDGTIIIFLDDGTTITCPPGASFPERLRSNCGERSVNDRYPKPDCELAKILRYRV